MRPAAVWGVPLALALSSGFGIGCGGGGQPAKAPQHEVEPDADEDDGDDEPSGASVSQEIGALDQDAVTKTFERSVKALQKCLSRGVESVEYLGGRIAFSLKIAGDGSVAEAHVEDSTIGHLDTERCMVRALKAKTWPKPVGGRHGLAQNSIEFDPLTDGRPADEWDPSNVSEVTAGLVGLRQKCGAERRMKATVYVEDDGSGKTGKALSVGLAAPSGPPSQDATDCIVQALKSATYPTPGSWVAKVSFEL